MTKIPEWATAEAARLFGEFCNYGNTDKEVTANIARALAATDEAATKRERERAAKIAEMFAYVEKTNAEAGLSNPKWNGPRFYR